MPFDGIVTAAVVHELNELLSGGKIDKVYQPDPVEIVLSIHRGKEKYKVFMTSNSGDARIQLISETPPNPVTPPSFCMLMRKHLNGGRIDSVIQIDTERIVEFRVDAFNEMGYPVTKKLIVEIMGKHSNISLVDEEKGKIIDSIKKVSFDVNRYRQLLPGMPYIYPPSQDKISVYEISESNLRERLISSNYRLGKSLVAAVMGLSTFSAIAICEEAGLDYDMPCSILSEEDLDKISLALENYSGRISSGEFMPCVWIDENKVPIDFHCFDRADYTQEYTRLTFDSIGEAEEYYYTQKRSTNRIRQRSADMDRILKTALDKLYLKKSRLAEDILQAENADEFRLKGELLFANIYKMKNGMTSVSVDDYYSGEEMTISLDPRLSPSENAQKYYKKYNKLKTALTEKAIQLEENDKEIAYLESVAQLLENADEFTDIQEIRNELITGGYIKRRGPASKQKPSSAPPHQHHTSEGFRILAGRNNKQNDVLTLKTAGSKDIWFHTKDIPGTHVILFTEAKTPSEKSLSEAASVAAFYSKGKQSENVPVDYTLVKYVRKPNGAKPGMVIFDHNKTLYVNPAVPEDKESEGEHKE